MFNAYVLIVVMSATLRTGQAGTVLNEPIKQVTMQEFESLRACKDASREVSKLTNNGAKMVCVRKGQIKEK